MVTYKKKKPGRRSKINTNLSKTRKKSVLKKKENNQSRLSKDLISFLKMLIKFPFLFINKIANILSESFILIIKGGISVFRKFFLLATNTKEVFFSIIIGFLSGALGAVVVYSYVEFNEKTSAVKQVESEINISNIKKDYSVLEEELMQLKDTVKINQLNQGLINGLTQELENNRNDTDVNIDNIKEINSYIKSLENKSITLDEKIASLKQELRNNARLIMSSSKTELTNRLYLAQSLVDRLRSGVPYAPQLKALGEEGLDPALLRFAKGGAPTISDLAARLSVRAEELKDEDMTKRDNNWRDNLKTEIIKYVKVKPVDINKIKGTSGVLLRAEDAISKGKLEQAIKEIDSLTPQKRGMLNAWLSEAKAKQNADIAAANLLAKTTAALKIRN